MCSVAERWRFGVFALAPGQGFGFANFHFERSEFRDFVGTIAKRLRFRSPTRAPPIRSDLRFLNRWELLSNDWYFHKMFWRSLIHPMPLLCIHALLQRGFAWVSSQILYPGLFAASPFAYGKQGKWSPLRRMGPNPVWCPPFRVFPQRSSRIVIHKSRWLATFPARFMKSLFLKLSCCAAAVPCSLLLCCPSWADEGMWLLTQPPRQLLKERHGFDPTAEWLDHLRLSSIKFGTGGSAEFVSEEGLILSNHHVGRGAVQRLSTAEHNYIRDGFYARNRAEEKPCPGLELRVLVSMEDVTPRVAGVVKSGMTDDEAFAARRGRTMLELAFGWLLRDPVVASVIAGATSPEQIEQNVRAADWTPSEEELAELDRITA